jgi:hypothetical protein
MLGFGLRVEFRFGKLGHPPWFLVSADSTELRQMKC